LWAAKLGCIFGPIESKPRLEIKFSNIFPRRFARIWREVVLHWLKVLQLLPKNAGWREGDAILIFFKP
jgi:hypothetical protein